MEIKNNSQKNTIEKEAKPISSIINTVMRNSHAAINPYATKKAHQQVVTKNFLNSDGPDLLHKSSTFEKMENDFAVKNVKKERNSNFTMLIHHNDPHLTRQKMSKDGVLLFNADGSKIMDDIFIQRGDNWRAICIKRGVIPFKNELEGLLYRLRLLDIDGKYKKVEIFNNWDKGSHPLIYQKFSDGFIAVNKLEEEFLKLNSK